MALRRGRPRRVRAALSGARRERRPWWSAARSRSWWTPCRPRPPRRSSWPTAIRAVTPLPWSSSTRTTTSTTASATRRWRPTPGASVWAHEAAATALREDGARLAAGVVRGVRCRTEPELAAGIAAPRCTAARPHRAHRVHHGHWRPTMRAAPLRPGPHRRRPGGARAGAPVLLAGDLIEQGAHRRSRTRTRWSGRRPCARWRSWPPPPATVVPGHGATVDLDFVRAQHEELTELAWLIRDGHGDGATRRRSRTRRRSVRIRPSPPSSAGTPN